MLGKDKDTCHFSVRGSLPDDKSYIVLGQPFLENYLVTFDQDNMRIGFGAMIGTRGHILKTWKKRQPWSIVIGEIGVFLIIGFLVCLFIGCLYSYYRRVLESSQNNNKY